MIYSFLKIAWHCVFVSILIAAVNLFEGFWMQCAAGCFIGCIYGAVFAILDRLPEFISYMKVQYREYIAEKAREHEADGDD